MHLGIFLVFFYVVAGMSLHDIGVCVMNDDTCSREPSVRLHVRPCELRDANAYVERLHRHHKRVVGHRFSIRVVDGAGETRGVAIVGRPVARGCDQSTTLEVTRLCTDGTKNACSMLYSAAARAGRAMGYAKIQTYILAEEAGTSLVASGWHHEADTQGGLWNHTSGPRANTHPLGPKQRWAKML